MSRYIITFDLNTSILGQEYHSPSHHNAYGNIRAVLERHGFRNIQGSVYLGDESISEAHGTLAIQELTARYNWFAKAVSNIVFYRIEADLNAQFIIDNVEAAKQQFYQQVEALKATLIKAGLDQTIIENAINQQVFQLPNGASLTLDQIK